MKTGIEIIAEERQRQVSVEGWTPEHDNQHDEEELAQAAACYARPWFSRNYQDDGLPKGWPWAKSWWKPSNTVDGMKGRIKELGKAGALIAAEIDRINAVIKNTPGK